MRSTLHIFGNTHSLYRKSPIILDTNLLGFNLEGITERLCQRLSEPFSMKVLDCNFLMASTFPPTYPCQELIQECMKMYDIPNNNILKKDGSVLLSITRESVSNLFCLEEQEFADMTPTSSLVKFLATLDVYRNSIARS